MKQENKKKLLAGEEMVSRWLNYDQDINDLIIKAIKKLDIKCNKIEKLFKEKSRERLKDATHDLKGFSANFKMQEIYEISNKMNDELKKQKYNEHKFKKLLIDLKEIINLIPANYLTAKTISNEINHKENLTNKFVNNKILFVDDEELILDTIERKINTTNMKLFFANSGQEALNILEEKDIAVLVIDLNMPNLSGVEFIKVVNNIYPDIIKIVFSIYTDQKIVLSLIDKDIYYYIPKERVNKYGYKIELRPVIMNALKQYNLINENKLLKEKLKGLHK